MNQVFNVRFIFLTFIRKYSNTEVKHIRLKSGRSLDRAAISVSYLSNYLKLVNCTLSTTYVTLDKVLNFD